MRSKIYVRRMAQHDLLNYQSSRRYGTIFGHQPVRELTHYVTERAKPMAQGAYYLKPIVDAAIIAGAAYGYYDENQKREQRKKKEFENLKRITDEENRKKIFRHETDTLDREQQENSRMAEMTSRKEKLEAESGMKMTKPPRRVVPKYTGPDISYQQLLENRRAQEAARTTTKTIIGSSNISSTIVGSTSTSTATTTETAGVEEVGSKLQSKFPDFSEISTRGYYIDKDPGNMKFENFVAKKIMRLADHYGSIKDAIKSKDYDLFVEDASYGQQSSIDEIVDMLSNPEALQTAIRTDRYVPDPIIRRFFPDKINQIIHPDLQEKHGFTDEIEAKIAAQTAQDEIFQDDESSSDE